MSQTTIQYVLARLRQIGITDVFGVPGDFAFPINDAICEDSNMRFIGCCNELNAAYAADGYARIKGMAAINTTYGPGELGALPGIAGAYAEHLPIFHLTGQPPRSTQRERGIVHHTLGNGEFDLFYEMTAPAVCARTIITPQNCIAETERLIAAALYHRRPVYMAIPGDVANLPVVGSGAPADEPTSNSATLERAVNAIVEAVTSARTACVLPGVLIARLGLRREVENLIEASGLPFATMMMDKSALDESHPHYIGMYAGPWMNEEVQESVEGADCLLTIGSLLSDYNTASYTARLDPQKIINVMHHRTRVGSQWFEDVEMKDLLRELSRHLPKKTGIDFPAPSRLVEPEGSANQEITADALYPRWARFIQPDDIIMAESGTPALGLTPTLLPKGATYHNQTLWGAIGWATPAAFGAALAAPSRRTVLITGEGSHQLTAQEVSQFHRQGLKPIIFVLNNGGYLIERLLCKAPDIYYNELAQWNYHLLPEALGCEGWYTARVTTCGELDTAISKAESCGTGAYIEVVTDKYTAPPLALKMHRATPTYPMSKSIIP